MIKTYKLEDLDCANCAAKMEKAVAKIPGVISANINFMSQKMTFEAEDALFDTALEQASKAMKKIEPNIEIIR